MKRRKYYVYQRGRNIQGDSPAYYYEIAEIATEGVFQTGHVLFHKGDFADSLFILLLGDRVSRIFDTMLSYKT